MREIDAIHACAIIYHVAELREAMGDATREDLKADRAMQHVASCTLFAVNSVLRRVDSETLDSSDGAMWPEVQNLRNKMAHEYGSVDGQSYYNVLTQVLPQIEQALRKHLAMSEFDCDEIHERIGVPRFDRDIGTDRETKGR